MWDMCMRKGMDMEGMTVYSRKVRQNYTHRKKALGRSHLFKDPGEFGLCARTGGGAVGIDQLSQTDTSVLVDHSSRASDACRLCAVGYGRGELSRCLFSHVKQSSQEGLTRWSLRSLHV